MLIMPLPLVLPLAAAAVALSATVGVMTTHGADTDLLELRLRLRRRASPLSVAGALLALAALAVGYALTGALYALAYAGGVACLVVLSGSRWMAAQTRAMGPAPTPITPDPGLPPGLAKVSR
jgi:hypothetical protein